MPALQTITCYVKAYCSETRDKPTLGVAVLPRDIHDFVLIDDPDGFDIMYRCRGKWCSLDGEAWAEYTWNERTNGYARYVGAVKLGRKILKRYGVKEMTWEQWRKR